MEYRTEVFAGVDWATDSHAVCVVDDGGGVVAGFDVAHTADGLRELCGRLGMPARPGLRSSAVTVRWLTLCSKPAWRWWWCRAGR